MFMLQFFQGQIIEKKLTANSNSLDAREVENVENRKNKKNIFLLINI